MASRPTRFHAVRPREHLDRAVLLLAFVLGAGGSAFVKLAGIEPEWTAAIWSAFVLFGYAAAAWALGQLRIEPETIGDNCYYLGFLYTLTSLAVTLCQLGGDAGGDVMRDIISGFGIALSSTIVGVFLRVLLMQIRPDIVARDREARVELHNAARDFRGSLAASIAELKALAVESVQLGAEQSEKIRAATDVAQDLHRKQLAESAAVFAEVMETALEAAAEKAVAGIGAAIVTSTSATLEEVVRSTEALGTGMEALRQRQGEALTLLAEHTERLGVEAGTTQTSLAEINDRLAVLSGNLETLNGRLEAGVEAAITGLEATAGEAVARLRASLGEIESAAATGARVLRLEDAARALRAPLGALESTIERMVTLIDRVEAAFPVEGTSQAAGTGSLAEASGSKDKPHGWFRGLLGARPDADLPSGR